MWERSERGGAGATAAGPSQAPGVGKQPLVGALDAGAGPGKQPLVGAPPEAQTPPRELVSPYSYPGVAAELTGPERPAPPAEGGDAKKPAEPGKETETGIATKVALDRFVTAAHAVQSQWKTLDKTGRAQKLGDAANSELDAAGVPKVGIVIKDLGATNGQLDFTPWNLDLNGKRFEAAETTTDAMAPVARTVYHESRHAEQWFRMARIEAGKGKKAAAIATALSIKPDVAKAAEAKPLTGDGQEAKEAEGWHKSVYGADAAARNTTLKNLRVHGKAMNDALIKSQAAQKAYDAAVAAKASAADQKTALDAWKAAYAAYATAKATYDATYAAYTALPEEADAWKLGDRVMDAYKAT